jgi:hypothetical protein
MTKNVEIDLTKVPPDQVGPAVAGALSAILAYAKGDSKAMSLVGRAVCPSESDKAQKLEFIAPKEN